jgi:hypothetical protein
VKAEVFVLSQKRPFMRHATAAFTRKQVSGAMAMLDVAAWAWRRCPVPWSAVDDGHLRFVALAGGRHAAPTVRALSPQAARFAATARRRAASSPQRSETPNDHRAVEVTGQRVREVGGAKEGVRNASGLDRTLGGVLGVLLGDLRPVLHPQELP